MTCINLNNETWLKIGFNSDGYASCLNLLFDFAIQQVQTSLCQEMQRLPIYTIECIGLWLKRRIGHKRKPLIERT